MRTLETKAKVIIDLQHKGYDLDFILSNGFLRCAQDGELLGPDNFEIAATYQFESGSETDLPFIIYAISSIQNGVKGILMTSYSASTKGLSIHLWSKLSSNLK
jgi:hypothetical protein